MTPHQLTVLARLAPRPLSAVELSNPEIALILIFVANGYAHDYSKIQNDTPDVRLRVWGISTAGRAILNPTEEPSNGL